MKHNVILLLLVFAWSLPVYPEPSVVDKVMNASVGLGANDLGDVLWDGESIWVVGSGTLNRLLWGDGHRTTDWISYSDMPGFGIGSIGATYISGDTLVVSWVYDHEYANSMEPYGDGFSISTDRAKTWTHIPIEDIFTDRPKNAGFHTMCWDIGSSGNTIWASINSGFLVATDDLGHTWRRILPDDGPLNLLNLNHYGQCIEAYGDTLWIGTFKGMNLSTDRGDNWVNFSWPDDGSIPDEMLPGNFCLSAKRNITDGKTYLWVGTLPWDQTYPMLGQRGICYTADNGATWKYTTTDYTAYNFAFGHEDADNPAVSDSTVFAAAEQGLVVSYDLGGSWELMEIRESEDIYWRMGTMVYGLEVVGNTLWVTSSDGLAKSTDWGETWEIYSGVTRVKSIDKNDTNIGISSRFDDVETYAFPNPFSPRRSNADYSRTRIQYALSDDAVISIYIQDFAGNVIRDLIAGEFRTGGRDYREIWDGRDDSGRHCAERRVFLYHTNEQRGCRSRKNHGTRLIFSHNFCIDNVLDPYKDQSW